MRSAGFSSEARSKTKHLPFPATIKQRDCLSDGCVRDWALLASTQSQEVARRTIELFGKHVIPRFDKDPVHRTTRFREAALARLKK